jgi:hypothetical protein
MRKKAATDGAGIRATGSLHGGNPYLTYARAADSLATLGEQPLVAPIAVVPGRRRD